MDVFACAWLRVRASIIINICISLEETISFVMAKMADTS